MKRWLSAFLIFLLSLCLCCPVSALQVETSYSNDASAAKAFAESYLSEHPEYLELLYGDAEYSISDPIAAYEIGGYHEGTLLGKMNPFPYYLKANMAAFGPVRETGIYHFIVYRDGSGDAVGVVSFSGEDNVFSLAEQLEPVYADMLMESTARLQSFLEFEGMDENQPMGFAKGLGLVFTTSQANGYASLSVPGSIKRTRDLAISNYRVRREGRTNPQSMAEVMPQTVVYQSAHYSTMPFWIMVIGIPLLGLGLIIGAVCLGKKRIRNRKS